MPRVPRRLRHVSANHVELVLSLVEIPETEPERNTRDEGNDSGSTIVPDQMWVIGEGVHSFAYGTRNGIHEEEDGHDK